MAAPPPLLPPGVYFNPTPEECVRDYLKPWIASGWNEGEDMDGAVFPVDIYRHGPGALCGAYPPGHARALECRWFFLTPCARVGGRGQRVVATGGHWKVEQKSKALDGGEGEGEGEGGGGKRRTYGFHVGDRKTPWLMEEITEREGGPDEVVPVLCRMYVSPRASDDEKRAILGEEGVAVDADGKPKPARVVVHEEYFDLLKKLLPASRVRVRPPPPQQHPGVLAHQGFQFAAPPPEFLGHQYVQHAPPAMFPGQHHGQHALPPFVLPGHQHGQAAPMQDILAQQDQYVQHAPPAAAYPGSYYVQAAAPDFQGHPYNQNADVYYLPPPQIVVAAQQQGYEEEEKHVNKKARLTYASPEPQATCKAEPSEFPEQSMMTKYHDADAANLQGQEPAPVPTPPPQESPLTGTAAPPSRLDDDASPPAAEFDQLACKQQSPDEPLRRGGSSDSSSLTQLSFGVDFGMDCGSQFMLDGMPPQANCDFFLADIDYNSWFSDDCGVN